MIKKIVLLLGLFLKNKPKLVYLISLTLIAYVCIIIGSYVVKNYSETILPSKVEISINNSIVEKKVTSEVMQVLALAHKKHEKRSQFLEKVNNILMTTDLINEYWIRLGLDGNLQITATMQIPFMIIETKAEGKYLVSTTLQIIAKNPSFEDYPGLISVAIPELKLNWKPKSSFKNKRNVSYKASLAATNEPINFPWIIKQCSTIRNHMQSLGSGYVLNKIIWTSHSGFSLSINRIQSPQQNSFSFGVLLGKENIIQKMKKLNILLNNLASKNLYPSEIDLDFFDKASFKISSSTQSASRSL